MKQYPDMRPYLSAMDIKPDVEMFFYNGMFRLKWEYMSGYGLSAIVFFRLFDSLPRYRWDKSLFPRKKEPSYNRWEPSLKGRRLEVVDGIIRL